MDEGVEGVLVLGVKEIGTKGSSMGYHEEQ